MLLKSLSYKNFRQFIGPDTITFSTDSDQNVTVIMGENGSGKTTLAQAFTWCLYGTTDFDDQYVLNKVVAQNIGPNGEATVQVKLIMLHLGLEYTMTREQKYTTDSVGELKRPNNTVFKIQYKNSDGQVNYVKESEVEYRMKEILPRELSRYFFFDGERIGNMSKEIRKGKSREFADAVKSLLGLSAFTEALDHLGGRSQTTVLKSYEKEYDAKSDSKIAEYREKIEEYESELNDIEKRLAEIDNEEDIASEKAKEYEKAIAENRDSEKLAGERRLLMTKRNNLERSKVSSTTGLIDAFNRKGTSWMETKMIHDALQELAAADKIDTGIPDIHARTIQYLINRKTCLCGHKIEFGSSEYQELNRLLDYIPPKSIGTLISQFARECELKVKGSEDAFGEISDKFAVVSGFDADYAELTEQIETIDKKLEGMRNVGELQKKYTIYDNSVKQLRRERDQLNKDKGAIETKKERLETNINELVLKDDKNRRIARFKAYATYMYQYIYSTYYEQEKEVREKLEDTVNSIFKEIYNGGFSLALDDKYNIQILVDDFDGFSGDVETSTAQSISIIFAFIAGVIKMARQNNSEENSMLLTEAYPLVMDAPLSAFDKTRIKTVCDVLPNVAEQVIIFIKDTDGEIAEENMGSRVGSRYLFNKKTVFETTIERR